MKIEPTSAALTEQIQKLHTRRGELEEQRDTLATDIEAAQVQCGRAIADGSDGAKPLQQLETLKTKAAGIDSALQVLATDLQALEAQRKEIAAAEKESAQIAALAAYRQAVKEADLAFRECWKTTIGPAAAKVVEAGEALNATGQYAPNRAHQLTEHDRFRGLIAQGSQLMQYVENWQKPAIPGHPFRRRAVDRD